MDKQLQWKDVTVGQLVELAKSSRRVVLDGDEQVLLVTPKRWETEPKCPRCGLEPIVSKELSCGFCGLDLEE